MLFPLLGQVCPNTIPRGLVRQQFWQSWMSWIYHEQIRHLSRTVFKIQSHRSSPCLTYCECSAIFLPHTKVWTSVERVHVTNFSQHIQSMHPLTGLFTAAVRAAHHASCSHSCHFAGEQFINENEGEKYIFQPTCFFFSYMAVCQGTR